MVAGMAKVVRERLNRDAIVSGALALADRDGLDAVTIRRLAQDHGVTPMALYWHFKEKDELLDGLAERLFATIELPAKTDDEWFVQLREVLDAFLVAVRPHPAVVGLLPERVLGSDAGLVLADRVLGLLGQAGFAPAEAADVGSYLLHSIITLVIAEPGPTKRLDATETATAIRTRKATLNALSPDLYPHVIASADSLAVCANEDSYFARGLDLLVEGTRGIQPQAARDLASAK
jgi:AcrR family transcriptional regulator